LRFRWRAELGLCAPGGVRSWGFALPAACGAVLREPSVRSWGSALLGAGASRSDWCILRHMVRHPLHDVDRRSFLVAAAAAAAAATGAAGAAGLTAAEPHAPLREPLAHPGRAPRFMKAVKLGMVRDGDTTQEKFALLRELGFDGVEIDAPAGPDAKTVNAAAQATGLVVHGVVCSEHWSSPLSDPDEAVRRKGAAAMERALEVAAEVGATTVLLVPAVVRREVSYGDAYRRALEEVRRLAEFARCAGVWIAIENVWNGFLLSPLEAARFVDEAGADVVGWYFDVGNVVNFGWPQHWIAALGPRTLKIDVKEYSRKRRDEEGLWKGFDVPLMQGDCDWPEVMRALRDTGYRGWMTAEIRGGGRERLAEIAAKMDAIAAMGRSDG